MSDPKSLASRDEIDIISAILSQSSLRLLDAQLESSVFKIVGESIRQILPGAFFAVVKLQPDDMNFRIVDSEGFDSFLRPITRLIGKDPFTIDFPFSDLTPEQVTAFEKRDIYRPANGLSEITNGVIPHFATKAIEKLLHIEDTISLSLCVETKYYGGVTLLLTRDNIRSITNRTYIEDCLKILVYEASMVIQRLRSQAELIQYAEELEQANSSKNKFFSIIAHDLRGPLGTALALTDAISENTERFDHEKLQEILLGVHKSNKQVFTLLENLLTWSLVELGVMHPELKEIELRKIVHDTCEPLTAQAERKEISIHHDIDPKLIVRVDKDMLSTVVRNLLSNAIKFSRKGSTITINSELDQDFIRTNIVDHGVGIPKDAVNNLFDIDNRYRTQGTSGEVSSGLGLILVKELVEKNQGKVSVISEEGVGSTFTFMLPLASSTS